MTRDSVPTAALPELPALLDLARDLAADRGTLAERARAILARVDGAASPAGARRSVGDTFVTDDGYAFIWTDQGCWADDKDLDRADLTLAHDDNGWPLDGDAPLQGTLIPVEGPQLRHPGPHDPDT